MLFFFFLKNYLMSHLDTKLEFVKPGQKLLQK